MKLHLVQERFDKNPTLAYPHLNKWHSYSNNKYLKWQPTKSVDVDGLTWYINKLESHVAQAYVVKTDEGQYVLANWKVDDWFSQHTGRRLLVSVVSHAAVAGNLR